MQQTTPPNQGQPLGSKLPADASNPLGSLETPRQGEVPDTLESLGVNEQQLFDRAIQQLKETTLDTPYFRDAERVGTMLVQHLIRQLTHPAGKLLPHGVKPDNPVNQGLAESLVDTWTGRIRDYFKLGPMTATETLNDRLDGIGYGTVNKVLRYPPYNRIKDVLDETFSKFLMEQLNTYVSHFRLDESHQIQGRLETALYHAFVHQRATSFIRENWQMYPARAYAEASRKLKYDMGTSSLDDIETHVDSNSEPLSRKYDRDAYTALIYHLEKTEWRQSTLLLGLTEYLLRVRPGHQVLHNYHQLRLLQYTANEIRDVLDLNPGEMDLVQQMWKYNVKNYITRDPSGISLFCLEFDVSPAQNFGLTPAKFEGFLSQLEPVQLAIVSALTSSDPLSFEQLLSGKQIFLVGGKPVEMSKNKVEISTRKLLEIAQKIRNTESESAAKPESA